MTIDPPSNGFHLAVENIQDALDTLRCEWASVNIVLRSLRSAFEVKPLVSGPLEQMLDDRYNELSITYDSLVAQIRHIRRQLDRIDSEMKLLKQQAEISFRRST